MSRDPETAAAMALNRVLVVGVWALAVGTVYAWDRRTDLFQQLFTRRDERPLVVASIATIGLHVVDDLVMAVVASEPLVPRDSGNTRTSSGCTGRSRGRSCPGSSVCTTCSRRLCRGGGIGLAATWGALQLLMDPAFELIVLPLAMGAVYVLGRKHVVPVSLAVVLVCFV